MRCLVAAVLCAVEEMGNIVGGGGDVSKALKNQILLLSVSTLLQMQKDYVWLVGNKARVSSHFHFG